jgi:hypothetical protein
MKQCSVAERRPCLRVDAEQSGELTLRIEHRFPL